MPKVATGQTLRSVERLLSVLDAFNVAESTRTLTEVSDELDIAVSTVRRLLIALQSHNLLLQDEDSGRFSIHPGTVDQLLTIALAGELVQVGETHLDELHAESGETVIMAMLDGSEAVHIDVRHGTYFVSAFNPVGFRVIPYAGGAIGKVLLAWKSEEEIRALLPESGGWVGRTNRSITETDRYLRHLRTVRKRGHAFNNRETHAQAWAVAAPVRDVLGRVVAALHVPVPVSRSHKESCDRITELVVKTAERFSDDLGSRKAIVERLPTGEPTSDAGT